MRRTCTVALAAVIWSPVDPAAFGIALQAPLSVPALFAPGEISTGDFESHPAFTPDGRTLFFVKSNLAFTSWTIVVSRYVGGRWRRPEVAPFSGQFNDADPFITPDGNRLYFISDRPRTTGDTREDMDIWYVDRTSARWGKPVNMGEPINSPASEWFPTFAADGTLYFGSGRDGGKGQTDLYRAPATGGGFGAPENLGDAINSKGDEYEPLISPDQTLLIFMTTGRQGGLGAGDLYFSRRVDGAWTPARNLGRPINSPALEISPYVTPDRRYFFFSSARAVPQSPSAPRTYEQLTGWLRGPGNGQGDLYRMDLEAVMTASSPQ